jgi:cytochrome c oxidase subunit 2
MPHFRVQMNAVPGMTTNFYFKPTITTAEMRKKIGNEKFDYVILCNKICGVSHYTMNMKVVVDSKEDFVKWLKTQPLAKPAPTADNANGTQPAKAIAEAVK